MESEVVFCEDLSLDGSSIDERFFFLPVLKSVSYHPLPFSLKDGADIIITPNGSPFDRYKKNLRLETAIERVKEIGIPLVYANQIGGQDELVFDGSSFAINSDQSIVSQAPAWKESFLELDFHKDKG